MRALQTDRCIRIPGKIILAGEYSVLAGNPALACAVDRHLTVEVQESTRLAKKTTKQKDLWEITSCVWDEKLQISTMDLIAGNYPVASAMVCETLREGIRLNPNSKPVSLNINCSWPLNLGLGSSSALRLGLLQAMQVDSALESTQSLQRNSQGLSSGCDAYVQFHGGFWRYQMHGRSNEFESKLSGSSFNDLGFYFFSHPDKEEKSTVNCIQGVLSGIEDTRKLHTSSESFCAALSQELGAAIETELSWRNLIKRCTDLRTVFQETSGYTPQMEQLARLPGCGRSWEFKGLGAWGPETFLVLCRDENQIERIRTYLFNMSCKEQTFEIEKNGLRVEEPASAGLSKANKLAETTFPAAVNS